MVSQCNRLLHKMEWKNVIEGLNFECCSALWHLTLGISISTNNINWTFLHINKYGSQTNRNQGTTCKNAWWKHWAANSLCYTEVSYVTFLKWFAFPLEFETAFCKKLEDTSVSHKYKNIYQSSHIENKNSCQNPAIAGTISMHATNKGLCFPSIDEFYKGK